jgi:hypothetical protein
MRARLLHYREATFARNVQSRESARLRRLLWVRVLVLAVLGLVGYAHTSRVAKLNEDRVALVATNENEQANTVLSFISSHRTDEAYVLRPDEHGKALELLLGDIGAVLQTGMSLATHGKYTVREVLRMANDRPGSIKVTLPYMGDVSLPLTFVTLALCCAVGGLLGNVFILIRQKALDGMDHYIGLHLRESTGVTTDSDRFKPDPSEAAVQWPADLGAASARSVLEMLGGLSLDRFTSRRFDLLLEGGSAALTAFLIVATAGMFWYLLLERWLWIHTTALPVASVALGAVSAVATALLVGTVGRRAFGDVPHRPTPSRAARR